MRYLSFKHIFTDLTAESIRFKRQII